MHCTVFSVQCIVSQYISACRAVKTSQPISHPSSLPRYYVGIQCILYMNLYIPSYLHVHLFIVWQESPWKRLDVKCQRNQEALLRQLTWKENPNVNWKNTMHSKAKKYNTDVRPYVLIFLVLSGQSLLVVCNKKVLIAGLQQGPRKRMILKHLFHCFLLFKHKLMLIQQQHNILELQ